MVALVGATATRIEESMCTTVVPNMFVFTVLVATTIKVVRWRQSRRRGVKTSRRCVGLARS